MIGLVFWVVVFAFLPLSYAAELKEKGAKLSPKVEGFLKEIEKAGSFEELGRAAKAANFSEREKKEIEEQIKKPPYSNKVQSLIRKVQEDIKTKAEAKSRQINKRNQQELEKKTKRGNKPFESRSSNETNSSQSQGTYYKTFIWKNNKTLTGCNNNTDLGPRWRNPGEYPISKSDPGYCWADSDDYR
jgi:Skp family chaperone for outer membrane proteins